MVIVIVIIIIVIRVPYKPKKGKIQNSQKANLGQHTEGARRAFAQGERAPGVLYSVRKALWPASL